MWKPSKDFFLKQTPCVWTEPAQFQLFKTVRCVNTLKKISVRKWIDGKQVKDKVREMTQWRCATSSSFIVALRRMMVKVLILGPFPLKQLHALAVIITDQHSAMPFNQSIQEGPLDPKLQRPTRLLPTYIQFRQYEVLTAVLPKWCPWIPPICQPDRGFTPFSISACVVSLIHHGSGKKHTEILCASCMKPDAAIQHKIGSGWDAKAQKHNQASALE